MSIEQHTFPGDQNRENFPAYEAIRRSLEDAVREALSKDWDLVALGCHEQAISHRIAVYLEHRFQGFSTDCEYNRRDSSVKRYTNELGEVKNMRPDIIVHKRISSINLMAVEIKANNNPDSPTDPAKLKALASQPGYRYKATAFVRIFNSLHDVSDGVLRADISWYELNPLRCLIEVNSCTEIKVDHLKAEVLQIYENRKSQS